jgi:succinate dehydrogenase flavin-adding protein (antitoxin of CptAB toxin-antitoxin module)
MLTFNFTRVFKLRGIDKPFSYLVKNGYSDNFATRVANNRIEKMNLKDVEKLCVLLQCTPNDLLQWIPNKEDENIEKHPLYSLKRTDKVEELTKVLHSVPLDKLEEIEKMILKEIKTEE